MQTASFNISQLWPARYAVTLSAWQPPGLCKLIGCLFANWRPVCQSEACLPTGCLFANWRPACQLDAHLPGACLSFDCFSLGAGARHCHVCTVCFPNAFYMCYVPVTCQSDALLVSSPATRLVCCFVLHSMLEHAILSLSAVSCQQSVMLKLLYAVHGICVILNWFSATLSSPFTTAAAPSVYISLADTAAGIAFAVGDKA